MRGWLGVSWLALMLACGQSEGSAAEVSGESTGSSGGSGVSTRSETEARTEDDDDTADPWDRSECADTLSGELEWSATLPTEFDRIARDLARGPTGTVYVVDGCLSLWTEFGERQWQLLNTTWTCEAMGLDLGARPLVVGTVNDLEGRQALLVSIDPEGVPLWSVTIDDVPLASQTAHDMAVDPEGNIFIAGLLDLEDEPMDRPWLAKLDPEGEQVWKRVLPEQTYSDPQIALDDTGAVVLAVATFSEQSVFHVVLTKYSPEGQERFRLDMIDTLGHPLKLDALAVDPDGFIALAGRDPSQSGEPHVLALLDRNGTPLWVRTSVDVDWLESATTIEFDRCGTIVLGGSGDPGDNDWGELWVAKVGREGELRWSYFASTFFFSRDTLVSGLEIEPDGGVLATGVNVIGQEQFGGSTTPILETWVARLSP